MPANFTITLLLPSYKELNGIYARVIDDGNISYSDQTRVTRFYQKFSDVQGFEQIIIELLMSSDRMVYSLLTDSLKAEIEQCMAYYQENQALFDGIDTLKICREAASFYDAAIKEQEARTRKYSDALKKIYGSLDMLGFREVAEGEEQALRNKEEHLKPLYKEEQKKLSVLYDMRKESQEETAKYSKNLFGAIDSLNKAFLRILRSYSPESDNNNEPSGPPEESYFDMGMISSIYNECNRQQFEETSEMNFYSFLNLQPNSTTLQIKTGEKTRVCYLIHKLYEHLKVPANTNWRRAILKKLAIEEPLYFAKYKEPVSDVPSRKSEDFAKRLEPLFN